MLDLVQTARFPGEGLGVVAAKVCEHAKIVDRVAGPLAEADREDPIVAASKATVVVESVAARGWASLGHLNGGDLVLAIDGQPVTDVADLERRMQALETSKPRSIVFEIQRGIRTQFVEIQPAWK